MNGKTVVGKTQAGKAWEFMDETALIAFGILLEEMAKEKLSMTGDLAFTEAAEEEEEEALAGGREEEGENPAGAMVHVSSDPSSSSSSSSKGSRYSAEESDDA
jgi:hypothetical protein